MWYTTLAQNLLQPLSGNKHITLLLAGSILLSSCAVIGELFGKPAGNEVVVRPDEKTKTDTIARQQDGVKTEEIKEGTDQSGGTKSKWAKKPAYSMAFILPFHLDQVELRTIMGQDNITGMQSLASVEFYEGALLALDTLRAMGLNIDVLVYDDMRDDVTLQGILAKPEMQQADVVVGPLFNSGLTSTGKWAKENEKFVVSPLSPSANNATDNPYFLMANSTLQTQLQELLTYWTKSAEMPQIIVASRNNGSADSIIRKTVQDAYNALQFKGYKPALEFATTADAVEEALMESRKNFVFIASNDELFVNGLMRRLSLMAGRYDLETGGLSPILDMESLSLDYFEKLHFQYPSAYWVNPLSPKLEGFREDFISRFSTLPTDFALRGYDLTLYLGYMMLQHGPFLPTAFDMARPSRKMLYEFQFGAFNNEDGTTEFYENKNVFILRFDNYRFERVN